MYPLVNALVAVVVIIVVATVLEYPRISLGLALAIGAFLFCQFRDVNGSLRVGYTISVIAFGILIFFLHS